MGFKLSKNGGLIPAYENQVKCDIMDFLKWFPNITAWRQNNTGVWDDKQKRYRTVKGSRKGISDILGFFADGSGRILAIEVKRPGEKASPDQLEFLKSVNDGGGVGILAFSIDDVSERIGSPGYNKKTP
jgi:hypothetical protein